MLLPLLGSIAKGEATDLVDLATSIATTLGAVALFVGLMLVFGRRAVPWLLAQVARTNSRELFTLAVLAIALGIAYGSAVLFGVSFALGAFFAGLVLAESDLSHRAAEGSLPLRDAFAVLFFVSVGMLFDPSILVRRPLDVLAVLAVILFIKSMAAVIIVRVLGRGAGMAGMVAASLAQIGEFSFILIGLGVEEGFVPEDARGLVVAGALLSIALNPFMFLLSDRLLKSREEPDEEDAGVPVGPHRPYGDGPVILVGLGRGRRGGGGSASAGQGAGGRRRPGPAEDRGVAQGRRQGRDGQRAAGRDAAGCRHRHCAGAGGDGAR